MSRAAAPFFSGISDAGEGGSAGNQTRREARRELLVRFAADAPLDPAGNLWRAIELPELAEIMPTRGRGVAIGDQSEYGTEALRNLIDARWSLADSRAADGDEFDFALANQSLLRIVDLPAALTEAARRLKPNGLFVATVAAPNFHALLNGPGLFSRTSRAEYLCEVDRRLGNLQYPTIDQWKRLFDAVGFELKKIQGYLTARQAARWEKWAKRTRLLNFDRRLSQRRGLPRYLKWLSHPLAWIIAIGVIDDDDPNPYHTGCMLLVARKRA